MFISNYEVKLYKIPEYRLVTSRKIIDVTYDDLALSVHNLIADTMNDTGLARSAITFEVYMGNQLIALRL